MIPPWFIILTLALGWNEFLAIVRNPVLTLLLLCAVAGIVTVLTIVIYLVWYTNLAGPVLQIVKVSTKEFGRQLHSQMKDRGFDPSQIISKATKAFQGKSDSAAVKTSE